MTQDETAELLRLRLPRRLQQRLDIVWSNKDRAISGSNNSWICLSWLSALDSGSGSSSSSFFLVS